MSKKILDINPTSNGKYRMSSNANPNPSNYGEIRPYERSMFNTWRDSRTRFDEWRSISLDEVVGWLMEHEVITDTVMDSRTDEQIIEEVKSRSITLNDLAGVFDNADLIKEVRRHDITIPDIWSDKEVIRDMLDPMNLTIVQKRQGDGV